MEDNAFIMQAIAGVVYLVVGLRLYGLSRRTGTDPERLIALTFLIWAFGYALYDLPYAYTGGDELSMPSFAYTSLLVFNLGNVVLALFTREVFRKQERWAGWLVVAIAVCLVLGSAGSAWVGDWEQVNPVVNPGYWPQTLGAVAPLVWMCLEGLGRYRNARRRLKLGLCDAITCHNFLLWGVAGALWAGLETVIVIQDFIYLSAGDWSGAFGLANGLLEIIPIGMIWMVFFAPRPYRRWIEGAAAA